MKSRKKTESDKIDGAVTSAINYEITVADLARKSVRRAWIVAFTSLLMSLILLGGYFYMLPLKEKVPYLIMADAYTGTATVARLRDGTGYQWMTAQEAVTRSNVAHFILARESYDASQVGQRDRRTIYTMSAKDVATQYETLQSKNNPQSPVALYGTQKAIRIKILSITLIGGGEAGYTGATVRFQRTLFEKSTGRVTPLDNKIATMQFKYNANLLMDEENRIVNPLGFQVTDYRVDNDYASPPSAEVPLNAQPRYVPTYETAAVDPGYPQAMPQGVPGQAVQGQQLQNVPGQNPGQPMGQAANPANPAQINNPATNDSQGMNTR